MLTQFNLSLFTSRNFNYLSSSSFFIIKESLEKGKINFLKWLFTLYCYTWLFLSSTECLAICFSRKAGNGLGLFIRCVSQFWLGSLSFSHSAFPNSFRFLKAIRHYRICQLRSSKHFSGIAVHRKLYKNISSYLICQVPSYSAFSPSLFKILEPPLVLSRLSSPALRFFLILI